MKITISAEKLLEPIKALNSLIDEAILFFTEEGLRIAEMDMANVAMGHFKITKDKFTEYTLELETQMGFNLADLVKILKKAKKDETITITEEKNEVAFIVGTRTFNLPNLELAEDRPRKKSNLNHDAVVVMDKSEVTQMMDDLEFCIPSTRKATGSSDKNFTVYFTGEGTNVLHVFAVNPDSPNKKVKFEVPIELKDFKDKFLSKYSFQYLQQCISTNVSDKIELRFKSDYPIQIVYNNPEYELEFFIAPRVEND